MDKPMNQIDYLRGRPIEEALVVISHRDSQCEYQQKRIEELELDNKRMSMVLRNIYENSEDHSQAVEWAFYAVGQER